MNTQEILAQFIGAIKRVVHVEKVRGEPFTVQGKRLIPVSQSIRIGGVGKNGGGGFVWNRPLSLTEEIGEGIYRHHYIQDETLRLLLNILISVIVFRVAISVLFRRK